MSALNPESRCLYTDALRPPPGYRFREAVAATYSLDLETLLTIPLHLCLFSSDQPLEELLADGVALREALRKTADRISVYAQTGRLLAPSTHRTLFSLLEETVLEVSPPALGGSFHPKFWLISFEGPESDQARVRLLVLTRNITNDRSWDLALSLDGVPSGNAREENEDLASLVSALPELCRRPPGAAHTERAERLADLASRTEWELPTGFDEIRFHAIGLADSDPWLPRSSGKLAVISPFVAEAALKDLIATTRAPVAVISRAEELDKLESSTLSRFERVLVLDDQAEVLEGEDESTETGPMTTRAGLHAKAYLAQTGWHAHLYVGSANATNPALVNQTNVELMAHLKGRRSQVGGIDELLGKDGLGPLLMDFEPQEPDEEEVLIEEVQRELDAARQAIVDLGLGIRFARREENWSVELTCDAQSELPGVRDVQAWLVTRPGTSAVSIRGLFEHGTASLPDAPVQLLTTFVAIELIADRAGQSLRFVLSLPSEGLPEEERDAAVTRDIIRNREGFVRYLLLLLSDFELQGDLTGMGDGGSWNVNGGFARLMGDEGPLFEYLTRTYCHDPERLTAVRRLIEDLGTDGEREIIPPEFKQLWKTFEEALEGREGAAT